MDDDRIRPQDDLDDHDEHEDLEDEDLEDEDDGTPDRHGSLTSDAIGPVAAIVVGFAAFYLSKGLPFVARLGVALVVMTIVVYITVEISRRRRHR